jgi:hypothetical protein
MKGFISKTLVALCAGAGLATAGCGTYRECVDPCYLQRLTYASRQEVHQTFDPQVNNGHVLDQTVWNYHFKPGTAELTSGGLEHLAYLSRRRPNPDPKVWLQTAQDLAYDPAAPDKFVKARNDLDLKRIKAIQQFLTAQTAGRPMAFEVNIHDPGEIGISSIPIGGETRAANNSLQKMYMRSEGALPRTAGAGTSGTTGGGGGGGGGR